MGLWQHLWPGWDAVWPNIVASIITGSVMWLWAHRHVRRLHRRHDHLADAVQLLQATHDELCEHLSRGVPGNES